MEDSEVIKKQPTLRVKILIILLALAVIMFCIYQLFFVQ